MDITNEKSGTIEKIKIQGFKKFKDYEIEFNDGLNILIGENESGKSTILDAINVVINQKYNSYDKYIIEELLNRDNIKLFEETKTYENLPKITIEIFLKLNSIPQNEIYFGIYHSDNPNLSNNESNMKYGIKFECCFDEEYLPIFSNSIQNGKIPYDFYKLTWKTFSDQYVKVQKKPIKILNIDNSISSSLGAFDYYNKNLYLNKYEPEQILEHKGKFREKIKEAFDSLELENISDNKKFGLNQKKLVMENILTIFENEIAIENMGKGKENLIKTETALNKNADNSDVILLEEPENHLSHLNLRKMIKTIHENLDNKQIILTTHNNLIVKQSDISSLIIVGKERPQKIRDIDDKTKYFFEKSDDFNLLQFLLCDKCILVEGRTEYQLVNYKFAELVDDPSADLEKENIEIISCYGKTFKNYLNIAEKIGKKVCVITDNDGKQDFIDKIHVYNTNHPNIHIFTSQNLDETTFEICLYNLNEPILSQIIEISQGAEYKFNGKSYQDKPVLGYMLNNKANVAYKLFKEHSIEYNYPEYIKEALRWIRN